MKKKHKRNKSDISEIRKNPFKAVQFKKEPLPVLFIDINLGYG